MERNERSLRQALEQLPTRQLDEMLRAEAEKEIRDDARMLLILEILEERESRDGTQPAEVPAQMQEAWEAVQPKWQAIGRAQEPKKRLRRSTWLKAAAAAAAVCVLIQFGPQAVGAEGFFTRLGSWVHQVIRYFDPMETPEEYVFETDHPGLQQIYDAAVSIGVTQPMVPTWILENSELKILEVTTSPKQDRIHAMLESEDRQIIFDLRLYHTKPPATYIATDPVIKEMEIDGILHGITENDGKLVAVWSRGSIFGSISAECQIEDMERMIRSIYR